MASCTGPCHDDGAADPVGYDWDMVGQRLVLSAGTVIRDGPARCLPDAARPRLRCPGSEYQGSAGHCRPACLPATIWPGPGDPLNYVVATTTHT